LGWRTREWAPEKIGLKIGFSGGVISGNDLGAGLREAQL